MSLKLTGGFGPIVGAMKVGKPTVPSWLINLTDTLSTTTQISINSENSLSLEIPGEYTIEVVSGIASPLVLKAFGGGGGRSGTGGFVSGEFSPGSNEIYKVWVGGAGRSGHAYSYGYEGGFGGGGRCGHCNTTNSASNRGSGGGLSGIFDTTSTHANSILIAAGGGDGGHGGYTNGTDGSLWQDSQSKGGSQTSGGAKGKNLVYSAGATDGSALQGGHGAVSLGQTYTGGGGGGGYYGGGGGGANNYSGGTGAGGSSYYDSGVISNFNHNTGTNSSDPHYIAGVSIASGSANDAWAGDGLFVFSVATE